MLKFLRTHIKLIIWAIVLSFIAWGAGTLTVSRDETSQYAGSIGGKKVSYQEYLMTFRFYDLLSRAQQQEGQPGEEEADPSEEPDEENGTETSNDMPEETDEIDETGESPRPEPEKSPSSPEPPPFDRIQSLTWQTLVLSREAMKDNISVRDEDVRTEVQRLFSGAGIFDHVFYETWIRNNFRGRPRHFEEVVRKHLAAQKLRDQYLEGVADEEKEGKWLARLITLMSQADIENYTVEKSAQ